MLYNYYKGIVGLYINICHANKEIMPSVVQM